MKTICFSVFLGAFIAFTQAQPTASALPQEADVIVYGGTSGAVIAAVQVKKMGKSVILVSPDKHLGGMTSGGLGWTDLGHDGILGGLGWEFYHRIWEAYKKPGAWKYEQPPKNGGPGQGGPAIDDKKQIMIVFEPRVAEGVFNDLIKENNVPVVYGRLDLNGGILKEGARIVGIRLEDGKEYRGKMFIDATYEGDVMAKAGVTYTTGRESNSQYGETINGLQPKRAGNQLPPGIDPYVRKGVRSSGLLPGVNPTPTEPEGSGDKKIQAYCYRVCLTNVPENRVMVSKPANYREEDYELLFRAIKAGQKPPMFKFSWIPNKKTDSNNNSGLSMDGIGFNYDYPDGDYATREKIAQRQKDWQLGLIWTLQNSPKVPAEVKQRHAGWGLPKDEFTDNGNWSPALYVRESRRMVSDYVLTEPILLKGRASRSIGMGAYAMDSHNVQRIVGPKGDVRNEGDIQRGVPKPYELDYGVIIPPKQECENLLVPFCISASHIAFGSFRMEPVLMVLGQSAATAACLAIDDNVAVQDVPYGELKKKLLEDGQKLSL